ncbi:hypothetical protein CY652_12665 [Burkholderia sp. WAC0059]|uniref:hypothetical protein n=1 Tax=Burkholderia sp. WAC0059 TaxID=2066022 RepID=UPI000C7F1C3E|nr:hypothetical protein [Burkholderia sp. WAC0059]PLZ02210.1 hypothetical protein CY652_12665 [Burkholderia sp. WAC0059]
MARRPGVAFASLVSLLILNLGRLAFPVAAPLAAGRLHAMTSMFVGLQTLIGTALSVYVIRYMLLDDHERDSSGEFFRAWLRYVRVNVMLGFIMSIPVVAIVLAVLVGLPHLLHAWGLPARPLAMKFLVVVLTLAAVCIMLAVYFRFGLLGCHVAIGGQASWRAAWRDSREHVWSIFAAHFVTWLPILAVWIALFVVMHVHAKSVGVPVSPGWIACLRVFGSFVGTYTSSACASWLYRRFAARLLFET